MSINKDDLINLAKKYQNQLVSYRNSSVLTLRDVNQLIENIPKLLKYLEQSSKLFYPIVAKWLCETQLFRRKLSNSIRQEYFDHTSNPKITKYFCKCLSLNMAYPLYYKYLAIGWQEFIRAIPLKYLIYAGKKNIYDFQLLSNSIEKIGMCYVQLQIIVIIFTYAGQKQNSRFLLTMFPFIKDLPYHDDNCSMDELARLWLNYINRNAKQPRVFTVKAKRGYFNETEILKRADFELWVDFNLLCKNISFDLDPNMFDEGNSEFPHYCECVIHMKKLNSITIKRINHSDISIHMKLKGNMKFSTQKFNENAENITDIRFIICREEMLNVTNDETKLDTNAKTLNEIQSIMLQTLKNLVMCAKDLKINEEFCFNISDILTGAMLISSIENLSIIDQQISDTRINVPSQAINTDRTEYAGNTDSSQCANTTNLIPCGMHIVDSDTEFQRPKFVVDMFENTETSTTSSEVNLINVRCAKNLELKGTSEKNEKIESNLELNKKYLNNQDEKLDKSDDMEIEENQHKDEMAQELYQKNEYKTKKDNFDNENKLLKNKKNLADNRRTVKQIFSSKPNNKKERQEIPNRRLRSQDKENTVLAKKHKLGVDTTNLNKIPKKLVKKDKFVSDYEQLPHQLEGNNRQLRSRLKSVNENVIKSISELSVQNYTPKRNRNKFDDRVKIKKATENKVKYAKNLRSLNRKSSKGSSSKSSCSEVEEDVRSVQVVECQIHNLDKYNQSTDDISHWTQTIKKSPNNSNNLNGIEKISEQTRTERFQLDTQHFVNENNQNDMLDNGNVRKSKHNLGATIIKHETCEENINAIDLCTSDEEYDENSGNRFTINNCSPLSSNAGKSPNKSFDRLKTTANYEDINISKPPNNDKMRSTNTLENVSDNLNSLPTPELLFDNEESLERAARQFIDIGGVGGLRRKLQNLPECKQNTPEIKELSNNIRNIQKMVDRSSGILSNALEKPCDPNYDPFKFELTEDDPIGIIKKPKKPIRNKSLWNSNRLTYSFRTRFHCEYILNDEKRNAPKAANPRQSTSKLAKENFDDCSDDSFEPTKKTRKRASKSNKLNKSKPLKTKGKDNKLKVNKELNPANKQLVSTSDIDDKNSVNTELDPANNQLVSNSNIDDKNTSKPIVRPSFSYRMATLRESNVNRKSNSINRSVPSFDANNIVEVENQTKLTNANKVFKCESDTPKLDKHLTSPKQLFPSKVTRPIESTTDRKTTNDPEIDIFQLMNSEASKLDSLPILEEFEMEISSALKEIHGTTDGINQQMNNSEVVPTKTKRLEPSNLMKRKRIESHRNTTQNKKAPKKNQNKKLPANMNNETKAEISSFVINNFMNKINVSPQNETNEERFGENYQLPFNNDIDDIDSVHGKSPIRAIPQSDNIKSSTQVLRKNTNSKSLQERKDKLLQNKNEEVYLQKSQKIEFEYASKCGEMIEEYNNSMSTFLDTIHKPVIENIEKKNDEYKKKMNDIFVEYSKKLLHLINYAEKVQKKMTDYDQEILKLHECYFNNLQNMKSLANEMTTIFDCSFDIMTDQNNTNAAKLEKANSKLISYSKKMCQNIWEKNIIDATKKFYNSLVTKTMEKNIGDDDSENFE